jgi:hypothetical protein
MRHNSDWSFSVSHTCVILTISCRHYAPDSCFQKSLLSSIHFRRPSFPKFSSSIVKAVLEQVIGGELLVLVTQEICLQDFLTTETELLEL